MAVAGLRLVARMSMREVYMVPLTLLIGTQGRWYLQMLAAVGLLPAGFSCWREQPN